MGSHKVKHPIVDDIIAEEKKKAVIKGRGSCYACSLARRECAKRNAEDLGIYDPIVKVVGEPVYLCDHQIMYGHVRSFCQEADHTQAEIRCSNCSYCSAQRVFDVKTTGNSNCVVRRPLCLCGHPKRIEKVTQLREWESSNYSCEYFKMKEE